MRFALLGDHADGLEMARALAASGRHEVAVYSGPPLGMEVLQRWGMKPRRVGDLEEVLADPDIEALIVAGGPAQRPGQLRRGLQSERHVLCVHPADDTPDLAYEASMLQADARTVLLPLLPEALHPAVRRLAGLARGLAGPGPAPVHVAAVPLPPAPAPFPPGPATLATNIRLVEIERWSPEEILLEADKEGQRPGFPGWDILRLIGGEIGELGALSELEEAARGQPLLLAGRFVAGGLFQATFLPHQAERRERIALVHRRGRTELVFPEGWPGPARLTYLDEDGGEHALSWEAVDPWAQLVEVFENAVAVAPAQRATTQGPLSWQDAIRAQELDAAARRGIERRRVSTLEYQEAGEEAGFKGTMTLVGCALFWLSLVLLILSIWIPWLGWLILPVLGFFLVLQLLRLAVPGEKQTKNGDR